MARVSRTELNQQTARVLARVAAGERIVITDRGRPVAEVVRPAASRWDELIAEGRVIPAVRRGALPFDPVVAEATTREIVDDVRADHS